MTDTPKLLTITQAARMLGVSPSGLRRWADKGMVRTIKLPSGYRRFERAEIDRQREAMGYDPQPIESRPHPYRELS
jgi:excisionase family DNA binding protein